MANYDQRQALDYKFGQLTAGVTSLDTTLTSPDFASLPSDLTTTKYVPITLADDGARLYETAWVTAHAAGSSAVTVVRGREGSTAKAWAAGAAWRCAPTLRDVVTVLTRASLPGDPHLGMRAFLIDENRTVERVAGGWKAIEAPFGHAGVTDGFQAIAAGGGVITVLSAAQELLAGMTFSNVDDALVVPIAGLYEIHTKGYASGPSGFAAAVEATINSTGIDPAAAYAAGAITRYYKFDAADYIAHGFTRRRLAANDKVRLVQTATAASSTWGTTGYNGAALEVLYVGP